MKKLLLAFALWFAIYGVALAVVNINTATKEELMTLKGVGENRALEIINYRTKNGPFKTVDDLQKVPGIGPGIMKQIGSEIITTGKTDIGKVGVKDAKAADAKKTEPAKGAAAKPDNKKVDKK